MLVYQALPGHTVRGPSVEFMVDVEKSKLPVGILEKLAHKVTSEGLIQWSDIVNYANSVSDNSWFRQEVVNQLEMMESILAENFQGDTLSPKRVTLAQDANSLLAKKIKKSMEIDTSSFGIKTKNTINRALINLEEECQKAAALYLARQNNPEIYTMYTITIIRTEFQSGHILLSERDLAACCNYLCREAGCEKEFLVEESLAEDMYACLTIQEVADKGHFEPRFNNLVIGLFDYVACRIEETGDGE